MVLVLSFSTSWIRGRGQKYHDLSRQCYRSFKPFRRPLKIEAAQRQKFIKDGYQEGRQDKRLIQLKVLNNNLKNCPNVIELFKLMLKNQKIMNEVNVSTSAAAAARLLSSKSIEDVKQKTLYIATFTLLNKLISQHVDKMNSQSVANSLSSLVKIFNNLRIEKKQEHIHIFEKLCERAMIVSNEMNTQNVSNNLWAMAKFQWDDDRQIKKIVEQAKKLNKKEFKPQAVSSILWALATLKYNKLKDIKDIQYFVQLSKKFLPEMAGQNIANIIWALQQLRYYDEELILQVEDIILNKNIVFQSQNISNIMLAFSDFGLQNKQKIFKIIVPKFISSKCFNFQEWSNLLYSLALLECPLNLSQQVLNQLLACQNQNNDFQDFMDIQLRQIQLAQIFYNIKGLKLNFPSDLEQKCKKKLQFYMREQLLKQNSFLDDVFPILKSYFDFAQKKILIYDDQIRIDVSLYKDEKNKIAVQTYTTQSYFVNYPEKLLGRCLHQKFLLEKLGWQVIQVSAFKWSYNQQYQQKIIDDVQAKFN